MKKNRVIPIIKKSLVAYLKQEDGTINKHALFSLGGFLAAGILSSKLVEGSQVIVQHNHSDVGHNNCSHTNDTGTSHNNCTYIVSDHTNCSHTNSSLNENPSHTDSISVSNIED